MPNLAEIVSADVTATLLIQNIENSDIVVKDRPEIFGSQLMLIANTSNWRKVAKDLIGDEPVTYEERSKKDTLRKRPIINIFSEDPEALKRVQSKAAEVE